MSKSIYNNDLSNEVKKVLGNKISFTMKSTTYNVWLESANNYNRICLKEIIYGYRIMIDYTILRNSKQQKYSVSFYKLGSKNILTCKCNMKLSKALLQFNTIKVLIKKYNEKNL